MPLVGPRFYGPDPGPCSSQSFDAANLTQAWEWLEFTYDSEGRITSGIDLVSGAQATYTWANGVLVSYSRVSSVLDDYAETYEYGVGYAMSQPTPTSSGSPVRYTLTANGYPLTVVLTNTTTGAVQQTSIYEYEGCRLQRRRAMRADGTALHSGDLTYEYDAAGHIVRRSSPNGSYDEYDYSCWTK
jgi:YD repeat-containing protein